VELIAEDLKEYFKDIEIKNLLVRKKNTIAQNKLNRKERIENLKDAFEINRKEFDKFPKDVALLDDLTTSGSTFREATKVLKENGVKNVICIAFARGK
jgi:predicted amidophosphoribosyltransferase